MMRFIHAIWMIMFCSTTVAMAGEHLRQAPATADPAAHYLFYMHGSFLEDHPDGASHPRSGTPYDWSGIVKSFSERGFTVISEIRASGTDPRDYAGNIAGQVKRLLAAGVPPKHITVAGHSKGGAITLITAAMLQNGDIKFINMAGCGNRGRFARSFRRLIGAVGADINGRLLSIYDGDDRITGSCSAVKDASTSVDFSEKVLSTGHGHQLFYSPDAVWMDPVTAFAKKAG
jgi:pimeloyl-ACP methyl ester carboxylesterase